MSHPRPTPAPPAPPRPNYPWGQRSPAFGRFFCVLPDLRVVFRRFFCALPGLMQDLWREADAALQRRQRGRSHLEQGGGLGFASSGEGARPPRWPRPGDREDTIGVPLEKPRSDGSPKVYRPPATVAIGVPVLGEGST